MQISVLSARRLEASDKANPGTSLCKFSSYLCRMASIYASLASLLFSDKYSDLTITCGGRTFQAHRAVVCSQSAFFGKACDSGFKVIPSSSRRVSHRHHLLTRTHVQESISRVVDLPDNDPYILERFLQFLYTGNYEDGEYPVLNKPSLSATITPEEVQEELDQAPGIDTVGVSDGHGEVPETQSRDLTRALEDGDDENDENDGDYVPEEDGEDEDKEQSEIEYNDFDESGGDDYYNLTKGTEGTSSQEVYLVDWPHSLFTSLRVYIMADKFGVPALKLLARERFYRTAEKIYTTCEDFPAVVDEMYRSTPPTDIAMREIACRLIANQYWEDKALRGRIVTVMREHGVLAVGVLHYMMAFGAFVPLLSKDDDKTSP
jgi:hypothetical protein